jgi:hypothetical protein
MKIEYIIHDRENVIAVVYKHETLGRLVVVKGNIDPEQSINVVSMDGKEENSVDMREFILSVVPKEEK